MDIEILKNVILSVILGFLIGLERNISFNEENEKGFAGSRTFAIISLIGFLSGYISQYYSLTIYFTLFSVILLSTIAYFLKVFYYHKQGTTTHFSAILAFLIGVLIYKKLILLSITITIITIFILNIKNRLKNIEYKLSIKDINSALLLLAMTFLTLPYLPNKMIYFINPYKTWLMAIIISSLSFIGYIAIKLFGSKYGILITGAAGGFVSSTGVTYTLSKLYSKIKTSTFTYASAIAIANTIMFARVFVEVSLINKQLAYLIAIPYLITTFVGTIIAINFYKKEKEKNDINLDQTNPLSINEAIKFAIIFAIIYGVIHFIKDRYGDIGIYFVSLISGIVDVDAITLSLSSLNIPLKTAFIGISIASISNSIFKLSLVLIFGKKSLFKPILNFFLTILATFITLAFISLTLLF